MPHRRLLLLHSRSAASAARYKMHVVQPYCSNKITRCCSSSICRVAVICLVLRCRFVNLELCLATFVHLHDTGAVATSVAVVRCAPYCDQLLVKHVFVAFLDQLMCASDECQCVDVVELVSEMLGLSLTSPVTLSPNNQPAPLGLTAHVSTSSGSDHMRSSVSCYHRKQSSPQNGPSCGTSCALDIVRTWSSVRISGDSPP